MDRVTHAQTILAGRAWTPELVLRVASELVQNVTADSLSLQDKSELVSQTIQGMLVDVEKAGTGLKQESSEKEKTTPSNLEDCKKALSLLPVLVDLTLKPSVNKKNSSCFSSDVVKAPVAASALAVADECVEAVEAAVPAAVPAACFSFLGKCFQRKKKEDDHVTPVHLVDQSPAEKKSEEVPASQGETVPPPS